MGKPDFIAFWSPRPVLRPRFIIATWVILFLLLPFTLIASLIALLFTRATAKNIFEKVCWRLWGERARDFLVTDDEYVWYFHPACSNPGWPDLTGIPHCHRLKIVRAPYYPNVFCFGPVTERLLTAEHADGTTTKVLIRVEIPRLAGYGISTNPHPLIAERFLFWSKDLMESLENPSSLLAYLAQRQENMVFTVSYKVFW